MSAGQIISNELTKGAKMIRVFNCDALAIQEKEYDWRTALHYFWDGHKDDYVLVCQGDKPVKTLSYHDVCYNRNVPEMVIYKDQDVFAEARKYFFLTKLSKNVGKERLLSATNQMK